MISILIQSSFLDILNSFAWSLGGSSALLVHGVDVTPNDIDIIVDPKDFQQACAALQEYLITPKGDDQYPPKVYFTIEGVSGEILGFPLKKEDIEFRTFHGINIPVQKLELEYQFYKARTDKKESNARKLELIEEELERRKQM